MAVNFDTSHKMQLEAVGFSLNKEAIDCKYGEALNFFICQHKHYHSFEIIRKLRKAVVADLETKDISFLLSTCSYNVLHLYTRFGWSIVNKKIISNKIKYLIMLKIEPDIESRLLSSMVDENKKSQPL